MNTVASSDGMRASDDNDCPCFSRRHCCEWRERGEALIGCACVTESSKKKKKVDKMWKVSVLLLGSDCGFEWFASSRLAEMGE